MSSTQLQLVCESGATGGSVVIDQMIELPVGSIYRWIAVDAVNTSMFLNKQL